MNPQHTVPTLDDNGYYLWDSHAINSYLVAKYGKEDSLYPKDLQKRGIVDQRLFFNASVLQPAMFAIVRPIILEGATTIQEEKKAILYQAYDFLETFFKSRRYIAGDDLTVADFCSGSVISTMVSLVPFTEKHKLLRNWLFRLEALPYYKEANQDGAEKLVQFLRTKLT